jgi:hypothetical protein
MRADFLRLLRERKTMNKTIETNSDTKKRQKFLTQPDLERTYALEYIHDYNTDPTPSVTYTFSGSEIKNALVLIPKWNYSRNLLYKPLHQMLEVAAHIKIKRDLADKYPASLTGLIQCAENGCEECQKAMRQNFAVFLAMNFREMMDMHGDQLFLGYLGEGRMPEDSDVISYPVFGEYEGYDGFSCPRDDQKDFEEFKRLIS